MLVGLGPTKRTGRVNRLEEYFPDLGNAEWKTTSPQTNEYNCIAWALGESVRWWWPDVMGTGYWPPDAPREESIAAFEFVLEKAGFTACESQQLEPGIEKIALFSKDDRPTHAARQLPGGYWTSKLGVFEDIEHELRGLEGAIYGFVVTIFCRESVEFAKASNETAESLNPDA